jgi:hypothetical protein
MNSSCCVMEICNKVDDVIWGESIYVWNDVFKILMHETSRLNVIVNMVENWVNLKIVEFDTKHKKVSDILDLIGNSDGVTKLMIHYQRIALRYRLAYDCCRSIGIVCVN